MQRKTTLELELGGQTRTLHFGFEFLDALVDITELPKLDEIARNRPWKLLPIVAMAALRAAGIDRAN